MFCNPCLRFHLWIEKTIADHLRKPMQAPSFVFSPMDLVLTKMMRGDDALDMSDAKFLIQHDGLTRADLKAAFAEVTLPDTPELHEAFAKAKSHILTMTNNGPQPSTHE